MCGVYVLLFTLFLPVFFVFHRKDLILLNLISTYVTPTSEQFLKNKGTVDLWKVNFCISKFFIQCNTGSCCVQITDGVNMYLYVCQSVGLPVCLVCFCLCLWYQIRVPAKPCYPCQTVSKFDALLDKIERGAITSCWALAQITKTQQI